MVTECWNKRFSIPRCSELTICAETSLNDAYNLRYDVILISDAAASGLKNHYKTALARVGIIIDWKWAMACLGK